MLSLGELKSEQLRHALDSQKQDGSRRIGRILVPVGLRHRVANHGGAWPAMIVPGAASIAGRGRRQRNSTPLLGDFRMVPVHFNSYTRTLHVAFAGDIEYRALLAIEQMLDCKAEPCVADASAVQGWLKSRELQGRGADQGFENICQPDEITWISSSYATKCCADDARVTRCGEYIWVRVEGGFDTANLLFRRAQHCE